MRTMAKDPVILGSGKRVQGQDEIIRGAEKLVDLLFSGSVDDQVDGASESLPFPGAPSRRRAPLAQPESSRVTPLSSPSTAEPDRLTLPELADCDREPDEVGEWLKTQIIWVRFGSLIPAIGVGGRSAPAKVENLSFWQSLYSPLNAKKHLDGSCPAIS